MKQDVKFESYKNYQEAYLLENEINYLVQHNANSDKLKQNHKEFSKDNRLILNSQERFKSKTHNVVK